MNIEQYEYMKGPNTGAGIKLHLHDQGDVALVKDQGIAVAPGTHGFVAVDLLKVSYIDKTGVNWSICKKQLSDV